MAGPGVSVPSTQGALWILVRGDDRTTAFDRTKSIQATMGPAFVFGDAVDTFNYAGGRDLSGYVDGTANPTPEDSAALAIVPGGQAHAGSSFVAVQRWRHDLGQFARHPQGERDAMIGRRLSDNEEIAEAPDTAHVKRTAQELFDPPTFLVRRSMPWENGAEHGLEFIAYGNTLDRFERILRRMCGLDDGIVDALFRFSRPTGGSYYWCPPLARDRLDLSALGL